MSLYSRLMAHVWPTPASCPLSDPGPPSQRGRGGHSAALYIFAFLLSITPLFAHHSAARYDLSKTVVVTGTVTEVLWQNPHVVLVMNDTKGQEQAFEAPS